MANLDFKLNYPAQRPKNITVTFNADNFERIAANFGLFQKDFLQSLDRAEKDIKAGRIRKIKSLASLRK